jgi:hypothetical protein
MRQMEEDVAALLSVDEFAEVREINGVAIPVIVSAVDELEGERMKNVRWEGQGRDLISLRFAAGAVDPLPRIGETLTMDGTDYPVMSISGRGMVRVIVEEIGQSPTLEAVVVYVQDDGYNPPVETSRETEVPCRLLATSDVQRVADGGLAHYAAVIAFTDPAKPAALAIGDRVEVAGDHWQVRRIAEERDAAGRITRRLAGAEKAEPLPTGY